MTSTREYKTWRSMMDRCYNANSDSYENYGGRGIKVCLSWTKFELFYRDMGQRPEGTSLDRIDQNGNYEPGNCRWATSTEQQRNRRNNHLITLDGRTMTLVEWSEETGIGYNALHNRLKYGWSVEEALLTPTAHGRDNYRRMLTFGGQTKCIAQWAQEIGMQGQTLRKRIDYYGWSVDTALTTPVKAWGLAA